MDRRTFMKMSGGAAGALWLSPVGCTMLASGVTPGELGIEFHGVGADHLVFDGDSVEYHLDPAGHGITSLDDAGRRQASFGRLGDGPGELNYPIAAKVGPDGRLYVVERGNSRVQVFDAGGKRVTELGDDSHHPSDLAFDARGKVYVSDTMNHEVDVYDAGGRLRRTIGAFGTETDQLNGPRGLAVSPAGELHVADYGNARVQVYSLEGQHLHGYGSFGDAEGEMHGPSSVVFDARGRSCVADPSVGLVHVFGPEGDFVGRFRPVDDRGQQVSPLRLQVAPGGRLYVWTDGHSAAG